MSACQICNTIIMINIFYFNNKVIKWIVNKVFTFLTFTYYIRVITEAFQHLLISSISEIYYFDTNSFQTVVSLIIALWVICFLIVFMIIAFILSCKTISEESQNKSMLREYFNGIRLSKFARIYIPLWILRRIIFVIILLFLYLKY